MEKAGNRPTATTNDKTKPIEKAAIRQRLRSSSSKPNGATLARASVPQVAEAVEQTRMTIALCRRSAEDEARRIAVYVSSWLKAVEPGAKPANRCDRSIANSIGYGTT